MELTGRPEEEDVSSCWMNLWTGVEKVKECSKTSIAQTST